MDTNEMGKTLFHEEAKYDFNKPMLNLVSPYLIEEVGKVRTFGTKKYGSSENWKLVSKDRYLAALLRHLVAYMKDNKAIDEESGLYAISHIACNINFLIEMEMKENEEIFKSK